jgi:cell division protein FtsB
MNNNYLRTKKPGVQLLQNSLRRLFWRGTLLKIGIIAVVLGYVIFGNRGILQRIYLEVEKQNMIERVKMAEKETDGLKEQLELVSKDNAYIEKIARERHGMIRSGETVYRIAEE